MLHRGIVQSAASPLHGADPIADLQEAMPPTRTHLLEGAYRWRFFFAYSKRGT